MGIMWWLFISVLLTVLLVAFLQAFFLTSDILISRNQNTILHYFVSMNRCLLESTVFRMLNTCSTRLKWGQHHCKLCWEAHALVDSLHWYTKTLVKNDDIGPLFGECATQFIPFCPENLKLLKLHQNTEVLFNLLWTIVGIGICPEFRMKPRRWLNNIFSNELCIFTTSTIKITITFVLSIKSNSKWFLIENWIINLIIINFDVLFILWFFLLLLSFGVPWCHSCQSIHILYRKL